MSPVWGRSDVHVCRLSSCRAHSMRVDHGSVARLGAQPLLSVAALARAARRPPLRKAGEGRQGTANTQHAAPRRALAGRAKASLSPADSSVREESVLLGRGDMVASRPCSRPCASTAGGTIEKSPQGPCQGCVPGMRAPARPSPTTKHAFRATATRARHRNAVLSPLGHRRAHRDIS